MWQELSLFSGIGGLDLAFEWAEGKVFAMCEIEPFCRKVLRKHWPYVPLFEDVREMRSAAVGAKHRRERIVFVAHTYSPRLPGSKQPGELRAKAEGRITPESERSGSSYVPNPNKIRCDMRRFEGQGIHGEKSPFNEADTGREVIASARPPEHIKSSVHFGS